MTLSAFEHALKTLYESVMSHAAHDSALIADHDLPLLWENLSQRERDLVLFMTHHAAASAAAPPPPPPEGVV